MTILQANKYHYGKGGAERYYLELSRALSARGHEVVHLAMRHPQNLPSPNDCWFVQEVDYRSALALGRKISAAARVVYNRETVRSVEALVATTRPRVAHLHNIYHQLSPSIISALHRHGVPMVQTLHDYKVVCPGALFLARGEICERCRGRHFHRMVRQRCLLDSRAASAVGAVEAIVHGWLRTYRKVARFLCPSRFMLEKVAEYGVPREKLVHLPLFIPIDEYRPGFGPADYFIFLGRLSREKGLFTLLEALRRRGRGRLRCRILGRGPLEEELRGRIASGDLANVELSGYLESEALHAAIRDAAFTVVPSEWYENLPIAVIESFALGTPVLGANIGGIPEMVEDGLTGCTFPPGDAAKLAEKIAWMEAEPDRTIAMGRAARERAERDFSPGPHLQRLERIYEEVISSAHRRNVGQRERVES